jgi:hypothetical protein
VPDPTAPARLADELTRFVRLGSRVRSMLNVGDFGAEFSALMLLFPLSFHGPMRVTDLAAIKHADASTAITESGSAACRQLKEAREALIAQTLSHWPAERVHTFVELFTEFNNAVESRLRTEPAAPSPRENA